MMDKKSFKHSFNRLLEVSVDGLTNEQKIKYMKKWIRDHEKAEVNIPSESLVVPRSLQVDSSEKIGELVRKELARAIRNNLLNPEKVRVLQDARHCKNLFEINYPMLIKVTFERPLIDQRTVNGYFRYWSKPVIIHNEKYFVCNDWYEKNRTKFMTWIGSLS